MNYLVPLTTKENLTVATDKDEQVALLAIPTPPHYIKKRAGRGGRVFDYIETNYVIARLNATFFFNWNIEVVWQEVNTKENQVAVRVRLTVKFMDGTTVVKEAFGSSEIKQLKLGGMVDFADDLKAAESDGLKKAASLLGIGWDVYSGQSKAPKETAIESTYDEDDFLAPPKDKDQFRNITLQLVNGSSVQVSKFEALTYFGKLKKALGEEAYYAILKLSGYAHANEIPQEKIVPMYAVFVQAWKSRMKLAPIVVTKEKKDEPTV
jgi:hypothetical protein